MEALMPEAEAYLLAARLGVDDFESALLAGRALDESFSLVAQLGALRLGPL